MMNENGHNWKVLRKHLSPPLTNRKTPAFYASSMNKIADELVTVMSKKAATSNDTLHGKNIYSIDLPDYAVLLW